MDNKRNGLLEIYRFIICFLPLYYHNYFFFKRDYSKFPICELAVDFFFMLSGFFLMRIMRREKDTPVFKGLGRIMLGRVKPMLFTVGFIAAFNFICMALFIRGDLMHYVDTFFDLFKYWWFVIYLTIAIGVLYLIYRLLKSEKKFIIFLAVLALAMAYLHYLVVVEGMFSWRVLFTTRTFGCIPMGILVSYIPALKIKKFNPSIPIVVVLVPTLIYLAYIEKGFFTCIGMILMFGALMYFSCNINVGGPVFDLIGKLSVRMYLYMAFVTMFEILGLTNHRILFVIDVALASLDLIVDYYRTKYKALKKKTEKTAEPVSAIK